MKRNFDAFLLRKAGVNNLIIFGIYSLSERGEKCDFEAIVKECFLLFPKIFSFSKHPKWPDARKLDRPLRTLRERKLLVGDSDTCFGLTNLGRKTAEEISQTFRQSKLFK